MATSLFDSFSTVTRFRSNLQNSSSSASIPSSLCVLSFLSPYHVPLISYKAAEGVSRSYDALLELFESIGSFVKRLEIYTKISLSSLMTEIIAKIMVELLSILAQAKKQIKNGRLSKRFLPGTSVSVSDIVAEQFAKKLLGDSEIENILRRLDRLTQDEARMMEAHILEVVHGLMNNMKVVIGGE
jgi:hypothetical protein